MVFSTEKWTPDRVRNLRGQRTLMEFGALLGVPKNTVWRWEAGYAEPDSERSKRLSRLARKEGFLADWKITGSAELLGDLEEGSQHLSRHLKPMLGRTADFME